MNKLTLLLVVFVGLSSYSSGSPAIMKPLSDELIAYVNEASGTTWKAGKSKFDSWSMKSIRRLMGVPSHHIGRPSSLPRLEQDVDISAIPGETMGHF